MLYTIIAVLSVLAAAAMYQWMQVRKRLSEVEQKYQPVIDADAAVEAATRQLEAVRRDHADHVAMSNGDRERLRAEYLAARTRYDQLRAEISLVEENLEDISVGLYKPHFDFQSSDEYKAQRELARDKQKAAAKQGVAVVCDTTWEVGGSKREGERMAKQNVKLFLRAFNAECDAAVANVAWNNVTKMEERIRKSFGALNQLGTVLRVRITQEYLQLKLEELWLTYEHERKRNDEREEQRRIREQIREEERAQREIEKAREDAEKEEARYEKALERARAEAARASGEELARLSGQIAELEGRLAVAHQEKERAVSRAQLTKSGYVYIISNPGSFGDTVFKIGMTRRLDPMERIRELGDASVPYPFDVHAMLYSDNAPELERELHLLLDHRRVNLVNPRKEFFYAVLAELRDFATARGIHVEFSMVSEAQEYRESVATRAAREAVTRSSSDLYPDDPFVASAVVAS